MSVAINLLPETRQARLQDRRRRQLVTVVAVTVWAVSATVVLVLWLFNQGQRVAVNNLTKQIASNEQKVESTSGLIEALTAQQHLATYPEILGQRVYLTKFLAAYTEANPSSTTLNNLSVDSGGQLTASGTANSYATVAKLVSALQRQHVTFGAGSLVSNQPYFTEVTVSSISQSGSGVSFALSANVSSEVTNGD